MATAMMDRASDFLGQKRIALVGLSREERSFSRAVLRELLRRGYDVVPVNPALAVPLTAKPSSSPEASGEEGGREVAAAPQETARPKPLVESPSADSVAAGRRCFARVQEIDPPVDGVLVMTPQSSSAAVVRDCVAAGVRRIWLHRGGGPGCASAEALDLCRASGIEPVTDLCPFMVLPGGSWFHRMHGFFRRVAIGER